MLYGNYGVNFFSTSELLYPNMKVQLRLIRATLVSTKLAQASTLVLELSIVHFTLVVLISRMIITRNEWTCSLILLWISTVRKLLQRLSSFLPSKTSSFKKTFSTKLPFYLFFFPITPSLSTATEDFCFHNTMSSDSEKRFCHQQFDLRHIRILRGGQPIVDFDVNCSLYVTTMKTMTFLDDNLPIPIDNFEDHFVLVFDLTSMQNPTQNCHYTEIVGEPLMLELNFTFPLEHVNELIVLGERMSSIAVDKLGVIGKLYIKWIKILSEKN